MSMSLNHSGFGIRQFFAASGIIHLKGAWIRMFKQKRCRRGSKTRDFRISFCVTFSSLGTPHSTSKLVDASASRIMPTSFAMPE